MTYAPYLFSPSFKAKQIESDLRLLLASGRLHDRDLLRRIESIDNRYRTYAATFPALWAPGLAITDELRVLTEVYLPVVEIRSAFARLASLCFRFPSSDYPSILSMRHNWLDILPLLPMSVATPNPAAILLRLIMDEEERQRFFFSIFLPKSFGGGFGRYPEQALYLRSLIADWRKKGRSMISCLDAACGSGEGTYELVELLLAEDFPSGQFMVDGTSLQPFELFSASHAYFPHEPLRQEMFRARVSPLLQAGAGGSIRFIQEDLTCCPARRDRYDFILCNGLLGGPLLHDEDRLMSVVGYLAGKLNRGGVLLASDRFHAGWKQKIPPALMTDMMKRHDLRILDAPEGVAAMRQIVM